MRYCPPIYVLCVSSHLWTVPRQIKFWAILIKSWDWRDPPPLLGQNPKFPPKKIGRLPLVGSGSSFRHGIIINSLYVHHPIHQLEKAYIKLWNFNEIDVKLCVWLIIWCISYLKWSRDETRSRNPLNEPTVLCPHFGSRFRHGSRGLRRPITGEPLSSEPTNFSWWTH